MDGVRSAWNRQLVNALTPERFKRKPSRSAAWTQSAWCAASKTVTVITAIFAEFRLEIEVDIRSEIHFFPSGYAAHDLCPGHPIYPAQEQRLHHFRIIGLADQRHSLAS